jgi:hypothetical protein
MPAVEPLPPYVPDALSAGGEPLTPSVLLNHASSSNGVDSVPRYLAGFSDDALVARAAEIARGLTSKMGLKAQADVIASGGGTENRTRPGGLPLCPAFRDGYDYLNPRDSVGVCISVNVECGHGVRVQIAARGDFFKESIRNPAQGKNGLYAWGVVEI